MPISSLSDLIQASSGGVGAPNAGNPFGIGQGPLSGLFQGQAQAAAMQNNALNQTEEDTRNQALQHELEQAKLGDPLTASTRALGIATNQTALPMVNPTLAGQVNVSNAQTTIRQNVSKMDAANLGDALTHFQGYQAGKAMVEAKNPDTGAPVFDWNNKDHTDALRSLLDQAGHTKLPDTITQANTYPILVAGAEAAANTTPHIQQQQLVAQQGAIQTAQTEIKSYTDLAVADIMGQNKLLSSLLLMPEANRQEKLLDTAVEKQGWISPNQETQLENIIKGKVNNSTFIMGTIQKVAEKEATTIRVLNGQGIVAEANKLLSSDALILSPDTRKELAGITKDTNPEIASQSAFKAVMEGSYNKEVQRLVKDKMGGVPIMTPKEASAAGKPPESTGLDYQGSGMLPGTNTSNALSAVTRTPSATAGPAPQAFNPSPSTYPGELRQDGQWTRMEVPDAGGKMHWTVVDPKTKKPLTQ